MKFESYSKVWQIESINKKSISIKLFRQSNTSWHETMSSNKNSCFFVSQITIIYRHKFRYHSSSFNVTNVNCETKNRDLLLLRIVSKLFHQEPAVATTRWYGFTNLFD